MAVHTLSTASTRIFRPECNYADPCLTTRYALGPSGLQNPWLRSTIPSKPSINFCNLRRFLPKYLPIRASVSSILPTSKPELVTATEKIPKWSSKAIKSFAMGEFEARKISQDTTGPEALLRGILVERQSLFSSEALLLGILIEGTNFASQYLRANGITLFKVRDEIAKVHGEPNLNAISPKPPLTEDAQKALDWAFDQKHKSGDVGEITTTHLLLGIWAQEGALGHKVLNALGFNNEKAKQLHSSISEPGFVD